MEGFIKIKNLVKKYQLNNGKELLAVNNVNLDIEQGDIYGIMGLSGAGKSTLIRLLNRLEEPTSGEIFVKHEIIDKKSERKLGYEDKNILEFDIRKLREFRKKTGMIFQHFNLLNSRNVVDNVAFPLEISGWKKRDIKKRVDELLEIVGLSDKKNNYPEQLSGGQKQRIGIARALATHPKILLCDEATSALDPKTTKSILELLRKINREFGITILLITHEMEVVKEICNKMAVMQDGEIKEQGDIVEIFSNPKDEITKDFISSVINNNIPESLKKELDLKLPIVKLTFLGEKSGQPLISEINKKFNNYKRQAGANNAIAMLLYQPIFSI